MLNLDIYNIILNKKYHRPLLFNSVLWSLGFLILLYVNSKGQSPIASDFIFTLGLLLFLVTPVLFCFYVLIPKLLKKEKITLFITCLLFNIVLFSVIKHVLLNPILHIIFPEYFFVSYNTSLTQTLLVFSIFIIACTLFRISEDWFYLNKTANNVLTQKNQLISSQLSALRSQINPHFLFNSLNVIYALSLKNEEKTTTSIIELSNILRYIIYDAEKTKISIEDEITLIQNFISFQDYKHGKSISVLLSTDIQNLSFNIYPMLLLPLIENAYKHILTEHKSSSIITISIVQKNNSLEFKISNPFKQKLEESSSSYSGKGLENLKKNLDIIYPNQHSFNISKEKNVFSIELHLDHEL